MVMGYYKECSKHNSGREEGMTKARGNQHMLPGVPSSGFTTDAPNSPSSDMQQHTQSTANQATHPNLGAQGFH